jgi:hypothetical protein
MEWVLFGAALLGTLTVVALWWLKHPEVIDTGDSPGNKRAFWNLHSKLHLGYSGVIAFVLTLITNQPLQSALVPNWLGLCVEVAQANPREGEGMFEPADLFWNLLGSVAGAILAWFIRNSLF